MSKTRVFGVGAHLARERAEREPSSSQAHGNGAGTSGTRDAGLDLSPR